MKLQIVSFYQKFWCFDLKCQPILLSATIAMNTCEGSANKERIESRDGLPSPWTIHDSGVSIVSLIVSHTSYLIIYHYMSSCCVAMVIGYHLCHNSRLFIYHSLSHLVTLSLTSAKSCSTWWACRAPPRARRNPSNSVLATRACSNSRLLSALPRETQLPT